MVLVSILALLFYLQGSMAQCNKDVFETDGKRLTTIYGSKGKYIIHALISLTDTKGCKKVTKNGVVMSYALKYAIDEANKKISKSFPEISLGLQIDDVCRSLATTMSRAIEIVLTKQNKQACAARFTPCSDSKFQWKNATAIIGTQLSITTIPLASLMSLVSIPVVSFSATSKQLSGRSDLYSTFFRTVPSDVYQVRVMLKIIKAFKWTHILTVATDDEYGRSAVQQLNQGLGAPPEYCIGGQYYVPYRSTNQGEKISKVVEKIGKRKTASVVIIFSYLTDFGELILRKAREQKVKKTWLTSEAWNPAVTELDMDLKGQIEGVLTVSLKSYKMQFLIDYMTKEIKKNWQCNMWLKNYLKNRQEFSCEPVRISKDKNTLYGLSNCSINIDDIVRSLTKMPGKINNLIDAATALTIGIEKVLKEKCSDSGNCAEISQYITDQMKSVSFQNKQRQEISFDENNDVKGAYYSIENLQVVNGTYQYVQVGEWNVAEKGKFILHTHKVKWPNWFTPVSGKPFPAPTCAEPCKPSTHYKQCKKCCCWTCEKCKGNNYTDQLMEKTCKRCGIYHYVNANHTGCIERPMFWLKKDDSVIHGITTFSMVTLPVMIILSMILLIFRNYAALHDPSFALTVMLCLVLIASFGYGLMFLYPPSISFCRWRHGVFFVIFMMFSSLLMMKSNTMRKKLTSYAESIPIDSLNGNLLLTRIVYAILLFLLELASIGAFLYIEYRAGINFHEIRRNGTHNIWIQCEAKFTASRLVSAFIPTIVLVIATFFSYRDRNLQHSFHEPQFLNITCFLMVLICIGAIPAYKHVEGLQKAHIYPVAVFVLACVVAGNLILPKIYVGIRRYHGYEYPMRQGTEAKRRRKRREKRRQKRLERKLRGEELSTTESDTETDGEQPSSTAITAATVPSSERTDGADKKIGIDEPIEEGADELFTVRNASPRNIPTSPPPPYESLEEHAVAAPEA